jgi:hypothetical protein
VSGHARSAKVASKMNPAEASIIKSSYIHFNKQGYAAVEIKVSAVGGHASCPPIDGSDVASQLSRVSTLSAIFFKKENRTASLSAYSLLRFCPNNSSLQLLNYVQKHPYPSRMTRPVLDMLREMAQVTSNRFIQIILSRSDFWCVAF